MKNRSFVWLACFLAAFGLGLSYLQGDSISQVQNLDGSTRTRLSQIDSFNLKGTTANTSFQVWSGSCVGTTSITFATPFTSTPKVFLTTTTGGGTTVLNDTAWVTNTTTTGCIIGYRTAAGLASAVSMSYNAIVIGQ